MFSARRSTFTIVVVALLAGCGASTLEHHAMAAHAMRDVLDGAKAAIEVEAEAAMREASEGLEGHEMDQAIDGARDRFDLLAAVQVSSVALWQDWVTALVEISANGVVTLETIVELGRRAAQRLADLAMEFHRVTGDSIPTPPPIILDLLEEP